MPKRILRFDEFPAEPVGKVHKPALKELVRRPLVKVLRAVPVALVSALLWIRTGVLNWFGYNT
ncbi:MAG: hypothetical protein R3B07_17315 [Polyangiaceae bacterium]